MTIDNNISLKPSPSECKLNARQNEYFDNLTKDIELLKLMLAEIKEKVDGRDTLINTGTINADTVNAGTSVATKDVYANGDLRVQGKANLNDVYIENSLVLGDLAKFTAKLIDVAQLLVNKADIEEADIKSAIIDTLKLKVELQRYDNNQNIVSFPSETVTQLGDIANNIVLAGFDRPKWNDETIAIDSDIANKYYNKTEINNLMDDELIDDLHRETDIIKGNTPVQKVAAGCVDTEGNILATADDAFMLYGSQGRDNIPRNSSLNDLVICGQYNAWKDEVANTINDKPDGESGPFDLTVGYSLADRTMPYQMYTGIVKKTMYIRFYNAEIDSFDTWQQFQFLGGSTSRPLDVGNDEISLKPEYGNELNIYGNNTSKELVIGAKGNKKDVYKFGENASSEVQAKKFTENGKDVAVIDDFLTNAFALNNIPLKANDDIDNLPLGTYATVDFSIFSQIKGNKPFNSPFKIFVFKGGKETDTSSQQLAIDWSSEQIAIRHSDGTSWTAWVQLAMLDSNGYVEKSRETETLQATTITGLGLKINDLNNASKSYGKVYTGLSSDWADPESLPIEARGSHGFCLEILPNKSNTVQRYTVNVIRKMHVYERLYDNNTWTDWEEIAILGTDGYVEKSKLAKDLESGATVDGALIPNVNGTITVSNNFYNKPTSGSFNDFKYGVTFVSYGAYDNFTEKPPIKDSYTVWTFETNLDSVYARQIAFGRDNESANIYTRIKFVDKWQEWKNLATIDENGTLNAKKFKQNEKSLAILDDTLTVNHKYFSDLNDLIDPGIFVMGKDVVYTNSFPRNKVGEGVIFVLCPGHNNVANGGQLVVQIGITKWGSASGQYISAKETYIRRSWWNGSDDKINWTEWMQIATKPVQTLQTYNDGITKEV